MFYLKNPLRNEFFPAELPECFNSNDLADNHEVIVQKAEEFYRSYSIPLKFSGYKSESSRRKFSIPNPYHYVRAAKIIVEHSQDIFKILNKKKNIQFHCSY